MIVEIRITSPGDDGARKLIQESDRLMTSLYPAESNHLESVEELANSNVVFVGAFVGQNLVGCGAAKTRNDDGFYAEIKRVFVTEACRGQGVSGNIMAYLENHLTDREVFVARLETGVKQTEALRLYRKLGYVERGPFGDYRRDPWSIYMEKALRPSDESASS